MTKDSPFLLSPALTLAYTDNGEVLVPIEFIVVQNKPFIFILN